MALKIKHQTKAEIPFELQPFYVERDGAWLLNVEGGIADKAKLDEFRNANVALRKQVEDLTARFEGIDPAEVRKLAEDKARLRARWCPASRGSSHQRR